MTTLENAVSRSRETSASAVSPETFAHPRAVVMPAGTEAIDLAQSAAIVALA